MDQHHHKKIHHRKIYALTALGLVLVILLSLFMAYYTSSQDPVSRFFKSVYPASFVGGRSVSVLSRDNAQKVALAFDPKADSDTAVEQLIQTAKKQQLLGSLGITVTPQDVEGELAYLKSGQAGQYANLVEKYFKGNEGLLTDLVVVPRVYDALLAVQYNSDFKLNPTSYSMAQGLLAKLKAGSNFEELASGSDDKVSGQLGGDLGFAAENQILPELAAKLSTLKAGEVSDVVAVSRLGYHILYLVEASDQNGEKLYHSKHILVKTSGFDQWLSQQLNQISVWRIK